MTIMQGDKPIRGKPGGGWESYYEQDSAEEINPAQQLFGSVLKAVLLMVQKSNLDEKVAVDLSKAITACISEDAKIAEARARLSILYEFERNHLLLVREFKDEIKFVSGLQEDLRRERARFFADTLGDVSATLNGLQVEPSVAAAWIENLVANYTKSLDLSADLVDEQAIATIGKIRSEARDSIKSLGNNTGT